MDRITIKYIGVERAKALEVMSEARQGKEDSSPVQNENPRKLPRMGKEIFVPRMGGFVRNLLVED